jgi:crotonobetainyl-CoA:carnitine CoA-transferase CaiB-like acyl-CoA transferase
LSGLAPKIRAALASPLSDDRTIDPLRELAAVLDRVGLNLASGGGKVTFSGRDPIVSSPLPLATMAAVALMAKAVSVAELWRFRGGAGQDLSLDLGMALRRLCPFNDRQWELLNGYPPGNPADPTTPFMPTQMYPTRDGRRVLLMNIYPALKTKALAFLGCNDDPRAIGEVVRSWNAVELETAMNRAGLQATVIRSALEFLEEEQFRYVDELPLIEVEKIGDSAPEPFTANPRTPLDGIRALGLARVIAGSGFGRAMAYHGADVLNIWRPHDTEIDFNYYSSNIGMRSSIVDIARPDGLALFKSLAKDADVFFANRRPGFLDRFGLSSQELASIRPGLIHVDISIYGPRGPWANRIGFDQIAGAVTGVLALEGSTECPKLPEVFVVNDYVTSWLAAVGAIAALRRRAVEGGSYRVRISLVRLSLWLLQLGIFDKAYARNVAGTSGEHVFTVPELFEAETPCGHYQGVTDQVRMTGTPGNFSVPLVPRGASRPVWLARQ